MKSFDFRPSVEPLIKSVCSVLRLKDIKGQWRFTPSRIFAKFMRMTYAGAFMCIAQVKNIVSSSQITGDAEVVVSLTSHGDRLSMVHLSIESIARGTVKPKRVILWLDGQDHLGPLPRPIERLKARGLEVRGSGDQVGPHTKYFPYVMSESPHVLPLVTADDDLIYPRSWLAGLVRVYLDEGSDLIICYRAHKVLLRDDDIAPYLTWPEVSDATPSLGNFATGVSGVIYPPAILDFLRAAGKGFHKRCDKADDIWLHISALRSRVPVRQVQARSQSFPVLLGSQKTNLVSKNVGEGGNDRQIAMSYIPADVDLLRSVVC